MRSWNFDIKLDPGSHTPLFLQISRAIADDIRQGRLRPGATLPGSRSLAQLLGVHRNTVVAAYEGLATEGWLVTRRAGGTFVSNAIPEDPLRDEAGELVEPAPGPRRVGFRCAPRLPSDVYPWQTRSAFAARLARHYASGKLFLGGGLPDLRLFPTTELAQAYRRALKRHGRSLLGLGDPRGHPRLREQLAAMLAARRGMAVTADNILVLRGTLMALQLCTRALFAPGDRIAVEDPGLPLVWEGLHGNGMRLIPIGVDAEGLRVDALQAALEEGPLRAVFVTPHHHYPTTVVMSPARRLQLMRLAAEHRFAVIEDDYDYEFHYDALPVRPLASADDAGVVLYLGSLSKIMAPGLRLGFLVAAKPIIERIVELRGQLDRQGDLTQECAIAEMFEEGEVERHVRRMRREYARRRQALVNALHTHLGDVLSFSPPRGGMSIWPSVEADISLDAWSEAAAARGVIFYPGRYFSFYDHPLKNMRLSFASLSEEELDGAMARLALAYRDIV
jgi:GntR family transcriptional regulator/MocR family aminotransferase